VWKIYIITRRRWNVPKRGERARKSSLSDGDKGLILEFVSHKIARGIGEA